MTPHCQLREELMSKRKWSRRWRWALAFAALLALPSTAVAQSAGGTIEGTVTDEQGAAVPGATVTATNNATGTARSTTTDSAGFFRLGALLPATYDVEVELSGFSTLTQTGVVVNVASTRTLEIGLKLASVEETITITDEAPLLATDPSIGTVVSQEELQNLPLNGRQFANVAVLAPGTTLGTNSDPTKPGQLVVQLGGGTGRNVNYIMDGGDNTDDTIGGALQNFNLEAVQEFKIQTMQYKAEYGRSSGGVLTVVTKTGTNDFRGSLYEFYRDDSLNAKTTSEENAGVDKQDYGRDQYGGSLGGPILKDRAHFFVTYEKTERDTNYVVSTGGDFPQFDGTVAPTPFEDELITAKATVDINPQQFLQVRYGSQENTDVYGAGPRVLPSGIAALTNDYSSYLVGHTLQLGGDKLNEFTFQYTKFQNTILPSTSAPNETFPSGFTFGQSALAPQSTNQKKYQYRDDFSWSSTLFERRHDFKGGVHYLDEPTLGGDFTTGTAGIFIHTADDVNSPIGTIQVYGGFAGNSIPIEEMGGYIQDDIYWSDRLTINVGVRYEEWSGYDLDQRSSGFWQVLQAQRTYDEYYLTDFWGDDGVLDEMDPAIAPRLGFTWDVKGDGRQLLRGGYGTFYNFPYTNANLLFPALSVQSLYGEVYHLDDPDGIRNADGSFFQPGDPLPPEGVISDLGFGSRDVASPERGVPYSDQISLGYSLQVNNDLGLNFEVVQAEYHNLPYRFRPNVGTDPNHNGVFDGDAERRFPSLGNFRLWMTNGRATYEGANVGFRYRGDQIELQGFYTYSETEGNVLGGTDEFRIADGDMMSDLPASNRNRRDQSVNPLDPLCGACNGPLFTDARHRLTFGGIYRAPWDLVVSGVFRYHSAFPYIEHTAADTNADGNELELRPGVSNVNSGRADDFNQIDLRVSRDFAFGREGMGVEVIVELFNVFDSDNGQVPDRFGNPSTFAGDPLQGEQRLWQLGARFHF
jgi:hypothetical protein